MSDAPISLPHVLRGDSSHPSRVAPVQSRNTLKGSGRVVQRELHFDLSWLGPAHQTAAYTLRHSGRRYPLQRHTPETLAATRPVGSPTHFARQVESSADVVGLTYVTGPDSSDGFPTLASVAISTSTDSGSYTVQDAAQAIVFMNCGITVLTPEPTATAWTSPERPSSRRRPSAAASRRARWARR